MMRSLYSAVSGLRNHQTRMDVIGNNIANVNTIGYKTSRTVFQDIFSQSAAGGSSSNPVLGVGGTNPIQIGLGIKLSAVDVMHTPAAFQRTDNAFDMMIGGDGFFIVEGPEGYFYTRAGNFHADDQGYLVTSDGYFVMGYSSGAVLDQVTEEVWVPNPDYDPTGPNNPDTNPKEILEERDVWRVVVNREGDDNNDLTKPVAFDSYLSRIQLRAYNIAYDPDGDPSAWDEDTMGAMWDDLEGFSVGRNGEITVIANNRKVIIGKMGVAMFMNPGGLEKAGNSLYRETNSSGAVEFVTPYESGAGSIEGGGLEMSNVDLAAEFTDMIVTQRGFQANSRVITVSDSLLEELINLKR